MPSTDLPDEIVPRELVEWMWGTGLCFKFWLSRGLENYVACSATTPAGSPVGQAFEYTMADAVRSIRERLAGKYDNAAPF